MMKTEFDAGDMRILSALQVEGRLTNQELADRVGMSTSPCWRRVKRLEESGWVQRRGLAGDGRVVMVAITPAGSAALEAFRAEFLAAMRADLEGLSDAQLEALASATETLGAFVDLLQQRV